MGRHDDDASRIARCRHRHLGTLSLPEEQKWPAKVGAAPKYAPYTWFKNREHEWIISQNIHRRSLTDDQRAALVAKYYDWSKAEEMALLARVAALVPAPDKAGSVPPCLTR